MGLAPLIVVLESPGLRRNNRTLHQAARLWARVFSINFISSARFWARVFSINFIMGVLTGIPVNAARFDGGDIPFPRWG